MDPKREIKIQLMKDHREDQRIKKKNHHKLMSNYALPIGSKVPHAVLRKHVHIEAGNKSPDINDDTTQHFRMSSRFAFKRQFSSIQPQKENSMRKDDNENEYC